MQLISTRPRRWWHGLGRTTPKVRFAVCYTCGLRHQLALPDITARFREFAGRHVGHALDEIGVYNPDEYLSLLALAPNSDVKIALQGVQTMTVTNLHSLASSATAGWQSAAVVNTTNLYLDDLWQFVLDFANTAPANSKAAFFFAAHSIDGGTVYTNPATGSEGTITLVDVTANPQAMPSLGMLPYTTQDEVAESRAFSMAATAGGVLPGHYSVALINHSGAALAASANTVKHNGVYATVI